MMEEVAGLYAARGEPGAYQNDEKLDVIELGAIQRRRKERS